MSKVQAVIYHMPDGQALAIPVEGLEQFIEFGLGTICDTSEVNGLVHFFPRGNA
jgi:hypothetical protein